MGEIAINYFETLFMSQGGDSGAMVDSIEHSITSVQNSSLTAPITDCEIKHAVFEMGCNKSPGPDWHHGCNKSI